MSDLYKTISIIGLGNFGYAFLKHLDHKNQNGGKVSLTGFDRKLDLINNLEKHQEHTFLHQGYKTSKNIKYTNDINEAIINSDIIILAIPSHALRDFVIKNLDSLKNKIVVNTAKALEKDTGKRLSEVFSEYLDINNYYFIAGGTIAKDLFMRYPLGMTLAGKDSNRTKEISKVLSYKNLKIYNSIDLTGVELASSFKNIISIIAGIIHGIGYSYGSETHIISLAAAELEEVMIKQSGVDPKTLSTGSQHWGNDMWMSATGNTRNRELGVLIGKGVEVKDSIKIMNMMGKTVEGVNTFKTIDKTFDLEKYRILNLSTKLLQNKIKLEDFRTLLSFDNT